MDIKVGWFLLSSYTFKTFECPIEKKTIYTTGFYAKSCCSIFRNKK